MSEELKAVLELLQHMGDGTAQLFVFYVLTQAVIKLATIGTMACLVKAALSALVKNDERMGL